MKNRLFTKLGIAALGLAMAVVTGAAIRNSVTEAKADASTVTMDIYASTGVLTGVLSNKSISWTSGPITFTNNQGSSTTAIRTSDTNQYRLYANSNASLTCNNGDITNVVFTATSTDYANALKTSLANSNYSTATASGSTVTVSNISTPEIIISSFSAQTRINKIVVTYSTGSVEPEQPETPVTPEPEQPETPGPTEEVVDILTRSITGATSNSYVDWSNKTVESDAVYSGNSAGDNSSIQLRSDKSTSGIITTTSGGNVKKVEVVWNSNTSDRRTLNIYGSNAAYTSPTDLYDANKRGKSLGTIEKGTSTELVIDDDYQFIGLRSSSGAMYITSISITWEAEVAGTETLESIYVDVAPTKINYAVGETFDSKGLVIKNHYKETNVEDKITDDYTLSVEDGYKFVTADKGTKTITVKSTINESKTTTFDVTVGDAVPLKLSHNGVKYLEGTSFNDHLGTFTVTYTDDTEKTLRLGDNGLKIYDSPDSNSETDVEITNLETLVDSYNDKMLRVTYTENGITVSSNRFKLQTTPLISYKIGDKPEFILNDGIQHDVTLDYTSYVGKLDISVNSSSDLNLHIEYDDELHEYVEETGLGTTPIGFTAPVGATAGQYNIVITLSGNGKSVSTSFSILVRTEAPSEGGDGESSYSLVENINDITTGIYLIAAHVNNTYFYLSKFNSKPASTTEQSSALEIEIVNKGNNTITIKNEDLYLKYNSGTNLGTQDTEYIWTISIGTNGSFKITSESNSARGIYFRASTYNTFGGYATSNFDTNQSEYYHVELFKKAETTEKSAFDYVNEFVNNFMHMNDINIADGSLTIACLTYYSQAKIGFDAMRSSYTGEEDLVIVFQTNFADAYQRYMAWAAANGDTQPFTGTEIVKASMTLFDNLVNDSNNLAAIIITASITVLSAFCLYAFARKTKRA